MTRGPGIRAAASRLVPPLALIALPVVAYVVMLVTAHRSGSLAIDFHNEIYPEAEELLRGEDPFPGPGADLTQGSNHIWPPLVGYLAAPLTLLPPSAADLAVVLLGLASFGAALRLVGVRDWRVYGTSALWAPVIGEMRTAHLTLVLCLLVAVVWRTRERPAASGLALGLAVGLKLFLWPLGLWLASLGRWRAALVAAGAAAASLLLLIPFIGILDYARLLRRLGAAFDQDGFNPYGLLLQLGLPGPAARAAALVLGLGVLAVAWRRRSLSLFVAAALLLSPIVWLDYFALAAIPLAVVQPAFSWIWLLPLLTWGIPSSGAGIGSWPQTLRVMAVFAVVVWYTERLERSAGGAAPTGGGARPSTPGRPSPRLDQ